MKTKEIVENVTNKFPLAILIIASTIFGSVALAAERIIGEGQERKFIDKYIELLPNEYEHKTSYRKRCKEIEKNCPLKGVYNYGIGVCKNFDKGMTRDEVFYSMGKFFSRVEAVSLVDAAVYVLCPEYLQRLPRNQSKNV